MACTNNRLWPFSQLTFQNGGESTGVTNDTNDGSSVLVSLESEPASTIRGPETNKAK